MAYGEQAYYCTHLYTHKTHYIGEYIDTYNKYIHFQVKICLTEDVSSCLDVNLHVVLHVHAAKVDTEQTGVEPGSVAVTYIANTRLGLTKEKRRGEYLHTGGAYD